MGFAPIYLVVSEIKNMINTVILSCLMCLAIAADDNVKWYVPEEISRTNDGTTGRFSERQIKHMDSNMLTEEVFLKYIHARFPGDKLDDFATKDNLSSPMTQNLVGNLCFEKFFKLYKDKSIGYDDVYVYVVENDYKNMVLHNSLINDWDRWSYSFNISRGKEIWCIIGNLPNEIMDNR